MAKKSMGPTRSGWGIPGLIGDGVGTPGPAPTRPTPIIYTHKDDCHLDLTLVSLAHFQYRLSQSCCRSLSQSRYSHSLSILTGNGAPARTRLPNGPQRGIPAPVEAYRWDGGGNSPIGGGDEDAPPRPVAIPTQ